MSLSPHSRPVLSQMPPALSLSHRLSWRRFPMRWLCCMRSESATGWVVHTQLESLAQCRCQVCLAVGTSDEYHAQLTALLGFVMSGVLDDGMYQGYVNEFAMQQRYHPMDDHFYRFSPRDTARLVDEALMPLASIIMFEPQCEVTS